MKSNFKAWQTSREKYLAILNKYSLEQLNTTPDGFNNNLIWNIAHVIVAQQRLVYAVSGLDMNIPNELLQRFKPGTKPTTFIEKEELDYFKDLLISLTDKTIKDYEAGRFAAYTPFTTGTGFHLASVEDAIVFNNYHEGLHLGYMMCIQKFI